MNITRYAFALLFLGFIFPTLAQTSFVLPGETPRVALVDLLQFNRVEGHLFYDKGVHGGRMQTISATPRKTASGVMMVLRSPVKPELSLSYFSRHTAFDMPIDTNEKVCMYYGDKDGAARVIEAWLPGQRGYNIACQHLLNAD